MVLAALFRVFAFTVLEMFIDEAKITVKAGDGGHIYLAADIHENTLLKFRYNHTFRAERGRHGEGSNRHGRNGEDLEIKIPVGTVVYDDATGEMLHDFTQPNER